MCICLRDQYLVDVVYLQPTQTLYVPVPEITMLHCGMSTLVVLLTVTKQPEIQSLMCAGRENCQPRHLKTSHCGNLMFVQFVQGYKCCKNIDLADTLQFWFLQVKVIGILFNASLFAIKFFRPIPPGARLADQILDLPDYWGTLDDICDIGVQAIISQ